MWNNPPFHHPLQYPFKTTRNFCLCSNSRLWTNSWPRLLPTPHRGPRRERGHVISASHKSALLVWCIPPISAKRGNKLSPTSLWGSPLPHSESGAKIDSDVAPTDLREIRTLSIVCLWIRSQGSLTYQGQARRDASPAVSGALLKLSLHCVSCYGRGRGGPCSSTSPGSPICRMVTV